jgi:uncharacterized protein (DUF1800 family)
MTKTRAILAATLFASTGLAAAPQQQTPPATEKARVIHLLQRSTFGVRPEDVDQVLKLGRDKWLDQQLHPERLSDAVVANRLKALPLLAVDMTDQITSYQRAQAERRQAQRTDMANMSQADRQAAMDSMRRAEQRNLTPEQRRERQMQSPQYLMGQLVAAKLTRSVYSERQLEEMMTDFWYNHFNVFFGKGIDRFMVSDYEEKAIRTHVFGKFRDMLGATAKHPAMLFYLDNASSVVPDSMNENAQRQRMNLERFRAMTPRQQEEILRRRGVTRAQMEELLQRQNAPNRTRGLNENYARELMELHTLGVEGGYTQKDVIEVARAFTGWTFQRPGTRNASGADDVEFVFRPMVHDRGEKVVLGNKLAAGRGIEDGEQVLDLLATHPKTARFLATKLVERFVTDEPPADFVNEIAAVFQKTGGDLREVTRALFSSPRFFDAKVQRAKVKTPFELVASALRVTRADVGVSRATVMTLRSLGHLPYNEPAPTGFPAASEDWINSGAMVNRMNFGLSLAANRLDGIKVEKREDDVPALLARLLPGVNTSKLQTTITNELAKPATELPELTTQEQRMEMRGGQQRPRQNARNAAPVGAVIRDRSARALGLALGSPDFQRK